ncbi:MAG: alpha/beta hydrolase [Burkholderiales bacterium]|nr:MAG: alpha/beta hydrolase [Burkholderiales bacterium]
MTTLPLILIPGLMCNELVWEPVYPHLSIALSQITVADHGMCDDLSEMAKRLLASAPDRFMMAGHSMGARVALEVMRLAPERVTHLALLDSGFTAREAGTKGEEEQVKRFALLKIAREQSVRTMAAQWSQGMVHPERLKDAPLMQAILDMFERKSADVFAAQINALLNRRDTSDVLRSLRIPTLVACGRQDSWATPSQHEAMHALIPKATLRFVEDAGHMAPMERPEAMAAVLNEWMA